VVNVTVITIATVLVGIISAGGKMHGSATVCVQTKGGDDCSSASPTSKADERLWGLIVHLGFWFHAGAGL
jgi:hypothetical protein